MYFTSFVLERNGYKLGSMTLYNADEVIAIFDDNNKFIQACVWTSDDKFHLVSIIDQLIKKGLKCKPLYINGQIMYSKYPWDIMEMNAIYC